MINKQKQNTGMSLVQTRKKNCSPAACMIHVAMYRTVGFDPTAAAAAAAAAENSVRQALVLRLQQQQQ
jgi:hypothetical protein